MAAPLSEYIQNSAIAFRGYNVTNLGRTKELLRVEAYGPILQEELARFSAICTGQTAGKVDLERRVLEDDEPGLKFYSESIALVVAVEVAQLRLLSEVHGVDHGQARHYMGYSLGELTALGAAGVFDVGQLLRVPLELAHDCAELADSATMGVLFSRGPAIGEEEIAGLCREVTAQGSGTIGVSAVLSPNTYLLIGQGDTLDRFKTAMRGVLPQCTHLRKNDHRWPPLHTPIVRQINVPDRASVLLEKVVRSSTPSNPSVLSLVTGKPCYTDHRSHDVLRMWTDHPQRLWDGVYETLAAGVGAVIHVGPAPNVIPSTFNRLADNVSQQVNDGSWKGLGMRAVSGIAHRPWLAAITPTRAALLRAPAVRQIILEDWLIEAARDKDSLPAA
ncbi:MAG: ACP S-malonyltransferase [Planctomycetota bacterium]